MEAKHTPGLSVISGASGARGLKKKSKIGGNFEGQGEGITMTIIITTIGKGKSVILKKKHVFKLCFKVFLLFS